MQSEFADIGKELVEASKSASSARGMVEELFPWIYVASKRMSLRAISRWLEETKDLKISHVSIAKALKNADEHFEAILDNVWPSAVTIGKELDITPVEVLFDMPSADGVKDWNDPDAIASLIDRKPTANLDDYSDAILNYTDYWLVYPPQARAECKRFVYKYEDESK